MKKITIILAFVFAGLSGRTQDLTFLNTNQSLLFLNPSYAGSNGGLRVQTSYRVQWPGLTGNFKTLAGSVDGYIRPLKAGLALSYLTDNQARGTLKVLALSLAYAQHLSFMENHLKIIPSVQIGYGIKSLDVQSLHYGDIIDHRRGHVMGHAIPVANKPYLDISSGILISYKDLFYAGGYVFHLNQPDEGMSGYAIMPFRMLLHASYYIPLGDRNRLQVSGRYDQQQSWRSYQVSLNTILRDRYLIGLGNTSELSPFYDRPLQYTNHLNPTIHAGYRSPFFSIQLSYSLLLFPDILMGPKTYEVHVSYNLRNKDRRRMFTSFETF